MAAEYLTEREAREQAIQSLRKLIERIEKKENVDALSFMHERRRNEAGSMLFDVYTLQLVQCP